MLIHCVQKRPTNDNRTMRSESEIHVNRQFVFFSSIYSYRFKRDWKFHFDSIEQHVLKVTCRLKCSSRPCDDKTALCPAIYFLLLSLHRYTSTPPSFGIEGGGGERVTLRWVVGYYRNSSDSAQHKNIVLGLSHHTYRLHFSFEKKPHLI